MDKAKLYTRKEVKYPNPVIAKNSLTPMRARNKVFKIRLYLDGID